MCFKGVYIHESNKHIATLFPELRSKYEGKSPNKAGKVGTDARFRRKDLKRRRVAQMAAGRATISQV